MPAGGYQSGRRPTLYCVSRNQFKPIVASRPTARPVSVIRLFSTMKYCTMAPRVAPSARRVPICLRRCVTLNQARPTIPRAVTAVSTTITAVSSLTIAMSPE